MKLVRGIFIPLLIFVPVGGCADSVDERDSESDTRAGELVFNDRNVEQIREELWQASWAQTGTSPKINVAAQRYEIALAANASGLVRVEDRLDEGACDPNDIGDGYGSGVLSSSTRLLTAHHVVYPRAGQSESIRVSFGGRCIDTADCEGEMVRVRSGEPPTAENALLANRLFGMSLHRWAHQDFFASERRNFLREGWTLEVEDAASQSFMPSSGNGYVGRDAVVLKVAHKRDAVNFDQMEEIGEFRVDRPGMFFGQVDSNPYTAELPEFVEEGRAKVWGAHFPEYDPEENLPDRAFMPIVSEPGYRLAEDPRDSCVDGTTCTEPDSSGNQSPVTVDYRQCFGATLDAVEASSGGGVFGAERIYLGDRSYEGHYKNHVDQLGIFQGIEPGDKLGWNSLTDTVDVDPEEPQPGAQVLVTALDDEIRDFSTRDTPEVIRGAPPEPIGEDGNGTPIWSEFPEGAHIGTFPEEIERDSQNEVSDGDIAFEGWSSCDPQAQPNRAAVGLIGAANEAIDTEETRTGSLNLVCAPYSCASWSDNWPYLRVRSQATTGKVFNGVEMWQDVLMGLPEVAGPFDKWLQDARELRDVEESQENDTQPRPPSYKLCPPNFVLNGIEVLWAEETEEVAGIATVACLPNNPNPDSGTTSSQYGDVLTFKLWADDAASYIGTYDWPAFHNTNEQFSVSARIGVSNPNGPGSLDRQWLQCDEESTVRGFKWSRDSDGHLHGLALECVKSPRPEAKPSGGDESCAP